ncbi:hypothetical protein BDB00DRAFT_599492 [Zychaea mexicana]|uniref:uncharacterized protein n=1 Tax=Zychaea mexicana TaxID=64656 RepID=UPI0022FEE57B|nr:uncharacterized protein BDB00DRAFT_599492 [Zychaea mexicana]KAI9489764.1 hypothetical protein BDB00DRAFT_599492 [Zychaea mexicana]
MLYYCHPTSARCPSLLSLQKLYFSTIIAFPMFLFTIFVCLSSTVAVDPFLCLYLILPLFEILILFFPLSINYSAT